MYYKEFNRDAVKHTVVVVTYGNYAYITVDINWQISSLKSCRTKWLTARQSRKCLEVMPVGSRIEKHEVLGLDKIQAKTLKALELDKLGYTVLGYRY